MMDKQLVGTHGTPGHVAHVAYGALLERGYYLNMHTAAAYRLGAWARTAAEGVITTL